MANLFARGVDILERLSGQSPRVTSNVCDWCASYAGASCQVISEKESAVRKLPFTIENEIADVFVSRQSYEIPAKYLAKIPDARLIGKNGLIILPDGSYAVEPMYTLDKLTEDADWRAFHFHRRKRKLTGCFFSSLMLWGYEGNYYHWLHDVLLRFYDVMKFWPPDIRLIVPAHMRPFQEDSLAILGIDRSQWLPFAGRELWALESLYFAPPTTRSGHSSPQAVKWLRDEVWKYYGLGAVKPKRRLFVSRRLATRRRITNETEVTACLQRYGFEVITAETLSFGEQASLFAEAEIVVTNHGAALTNVMFMPPAATVVEIFDPSLIHYTYWTLSEALGFPYWYCVGKSMPNQRYPSQNDIFVPLDKLERTLQAALSLSPS